MNDRKKRRSAQEILAERKEQVARAEARAAREIAQETPAARIILSEIEANNKALSLARRGFVKGRQNFDNRVKSHTLWITEIEAERDLANASISLLEERKERMDNALSVVLGTVSGGEEPEEAEVEALIYAAIDESDDLYSPQVETMTESYNSARDNRKAFTDELKAPKKNAEEENAEDFSAEA